MIDFPRSNRPILAGLLVISHSFFSVSQVQAQSESDCGCIVATPGTFESAIGSVRVSAENGLGEGIPGTVLGSGSQVLVGAGSAGVRFGTDVRFGSDCNIVSLGSNSELTVSDLGDGRLCVRLTSQEPVPVVQENNPLVLGAGILAGGAMIGTIIYLSNKSSTGSGGPVSN